MTGLSASRSNKVTSLPSMSLSLKSMAMSPIPRSSRDLTGEVASGVCAGVGDDVELGEFVGDGTVGDGVGSVVVGIDVV